VTLVEPQASIRSRIHDRWVTPLGERARLSASLRGGIVDDSTLTGNKARIDLVEGACGVASPPDAPASPGLIVRVPILFFLESQVDARHDKAPTGLWRTGA
jgi:hypothetical protein